MTLPVSTNCSGRTVTAQQQADALLSVWQLQRAAGVKPEDRRLDPEYERDLEVIRQCLRRKS